MYLMKLTLFIMLSLLTYTSLTAQKEANIWYYGQQAGLNFNVIPPTPLFDGAITSNESSAVMADKRTGSLLFYTDGIKVWNKSHRVMPNGNGLLAAITTSTQGALIVPAPGNDNLFYIFTVAAPNYYVFTTPGLFYSVIDMQADRGQGDVIDSQKNIPLLNEVTEKLTAIPHQNGQDYWVITHGWNSNLFYVYLINSQGVSAPKTYLSGTVHKDTTEELSQAAGYLKASPNGKWLACAVQSNTKNRPFELYKFDTFTGQISNYKNLGEFRGQYGVSFSPNNTKLYLTLSTSNTQTSPDSTLCQFDLSSTNDDEPISFQYIKYPLVIGLNPYEGGSNPELKKPIPLKWALQLGPDGKLYCSSPYVINRPNLKGDSCSISSLDPVLNGKPNRSFTIGLPNFIQSTFNNLPTKDNLGLGDCSLNQSISVYPNPTVNQITIRLKESCRALFTYRVFNILGQVLEDSLLVSTLTTIDLSAYATGHYFVEIKADQQRKTFKILKI